VLSHEDVIGVIENGFQRVLDLFVAHMLLFPLASEWRRL
jgi:hypothetical protein